MRFRDASSGLFMLGALALFVPACRSGRSACQCAPEFAAVTRNYDVAQCQGVSATESLSPVVDELVGAHPVETYIRFALSQNPVVQAAVHRVDALANKVPQAASLKDPTLSAMGYPFLPYVPQSAAGRVTVDLTVSQEVPWFGKRAALASAAAAEVDAARAELAAAEWDTVEKVKRAYYELYSAEQSIRILEKDRQLLKELNDLVESRYRANSTSQQDMLRVQVQLAELDGELIGMKQEMRSAQARLARQLHASPDTDVRAVEHLEPDDLPQDLNRLYELAVLARPELHSLLAELQRDRHKVASAELMYYPDVTVSANWGEMTTNQASSPVADGLDMVGAGVMVNLPVYRQRLAAGVREAKADVVVTARRYDAMRDETLADVKDLFSQAERHRELLQLFRSDILPKSEQSLSVSMSSYRTSAVDLLSLIDNWRQLLRYQVQVVRTEAQLRQTLASLERVVGQQWTVESFQSGYCPPMPLPWTGYSSCPTPVAIQYETHELPPPSPQQQ